MKFNKEELFVWAKEWKWGIVLFTNAILFLGFFIYDINRRSSIGDREIIGDITYKFNQIQRKFEREITWDDIDAQGVVTNFDSIRSDKNSVAVIHLKDGTEIEMDEESMVILELTSKNQKINFEKGSINVKKTPVEGESQGSITVESKEGKVKINDGDVILAKENEKNLNVSVFRGEAVVEVEGKTIQLKKDQVLKTDESGDIQAQQSKVRMESPVERTNRMERSVLLTQKKLISSPEEIIQTKKVQNSPQPTTTKNTVENNVNSGSTASVPEAKPENPNRKGQPASIYNPEETKKKPSTPTRNSENSDYERRRKEQEALERFLKM